MENKKKMKRIRKSVSWGLGIVISDSDSSKVGRIFKIPKKLLDRAQPIKSSAFLNPDFEEIMKLTGGRKRQ